MAPNTKPQSSLIIYLIILIGLVGGFLYNSQVSTPVTVPPISQEGAEIFRILGGLKINYGVLDNVNYRALTVYGELPVVPGPGGKFDPFSP